MIITNVKFCLGQLWKLSDTSLECKANIWKSGETWSVVQKKNFEYFQIKNTTKNKFLGVIDGKVELVESSTGLFDLWKTWKKTKDGYFTIMNAHYKKVLTAISTDTLAIKGKLFSIYLCISIFITPLKISFK